MSLEAVLILDHLVVGYQKNRPVFGPITATLPAQCVVGLLGPNGVGKSTLLRTLCGLQPPLEGQCHSPLTQGTLKNSLCAFVPAQPVRAAQLTVEEMISTGRYRYTNWLGIEDAQGMALIAQAMQQTGIAHLKGRDSAGLSDGEYQRAAIARALVQQTPVVLMDEPGAFLDIAHKRALGELVRALARERSLLVSTHDLSWALTYCHLLWVMLEGAFYCGTPQALQEQGILTQLEYSDTNK